MNKHSALDQTQEMPAFNPATDAAYLVASECSAKTYRKAFYKSASNDLKATQEMPAFSIAALLADRAARS